jgi:hypothetical protein
MALTLQQLVPAHNIFVDKSGICTYSSGMNYTLQISASTNTALRCRLSLPRTTSTSKGVKLKAVSLLYMITSGTATSMTPTLTKYVYTDGAAESTSSIAITTPDASFPAETYVLTTTATVNRGRSSVNTQAYENSANTESINWLFNVAIVPASAMEMTVYGVEVTYDTDASGANTSDSAQTVSYTADFAKSGMLQPIDSSGGAVIVTLPNITAVSRGVTFTFKSLSSTTNNIQISPDASDSIEGLNLNAGGTVDKDFILDSPVSGDYITIVSNGPDGADGDTTGRWQVQASAGIWTREA